MRSYLYGSVLVAFLFACLGLRALAMQRSPNKPIAASQKKAKHKAAKVKKASRSASHKVAAALIQSLVIGPLQKSELRRSLITRSGWRRTRSYRQVLAKKADRQGRLHFQILATWRWRRPRSKPPKKQRSHLYAQGYVTPNKRLYLKKKWQKSYTRVLPPKRKARKG